MGKRKRREFVTDDTPLTSNPFAALGAGLGEVSSSPAVQPESKVAEREAEPGASAMPERVVLRRQKKGQGGKTATFVEGLDADQRAEVLPQLKRELGCGGRVEGEALVLGTKDHARVGGWFERAGVARVVLGN